MRITPSCPGCTFSDFRPFARKGSYVYLQCRRCRLLALDPIPTNSEIALHYQQKFEKGNYSAIRAFADEYRSVHRQYVSWMAKFTKLGGARVLDVGCFTGDLIELMISEAGADAYGIELQSEAAAIAEARLPARIFRHNIDERCEFLAEGSFDVMTMMGLIEHVQKPGALLTRARGLLKTGGWLFLQTPNASSWGARLSRTTWPPLAPVEHLYLFSETAIEQALSRTGFETLVIRAHVKQLPIAYVYEMLQHFGPEWRRVLGPLYRALPRQVQRSSAPFYTGEMLVAARAT